MPDLLAAPDSASWAEYSIEFCGGTHLGNTGQAEAFALLQEEGVARGVRRITATTGAAAKEAIALGEALTARVAAARALSGEELEAELGWLKTEVPAAVVPLVAKRALQAGVAELAAAALNAAKAGQKALLETAKAEGAARGAAAHAASSPFVVARLDVEADAKALDAASLAFKAAAPDTVRALRRVCTARPAAPAPPPPARAHATATPRRPRRPRPATPGRRRCCSSA